MIEQVGHGTEALVIGNTSTDNILKVNDKALIETNIWNKISKRPVENPAASLFPTNTGRVVPYDQNLLPVLVGNMLYGPTLQAESVPYMGGTIYAIELKRAHQHQ